MTKTLISVSLASLIFIHLHNALLLVMIDLEVSLEATARRGWLRHLRQRQPRACRRRVGGRRALHAFRIRDLCTATVSSRLAQAQCLCTCKRCTLRLLSGYVANKARNKEADKSALASVNSGQGGSTVVNLVPGPSW